MRKFLTKSWTRLLATGGMAMALTLPTTIAPSTAQGQEYNKFFCATSQGEYATKMRTTNGNIPLLIYTQQFGEQWSSSRRCEEISKRFQRHHDNGSLNYITTGEVNSYPVLCIAQAKKAACPENNVLITLQPGRDAHDVLHNLIDLPNRNTEGIAIGYEQVFSYDNAGNLYADFNTLIEVLPVEE